MQARGVHDSNSRLQLITAGCSYQGRSVLLCSDIAPLQAALPLA